MDYLDHKIGKLADDYQKAIDQITNVSASAVGNLPKKLAGYQKLIQVAEKQKENWDKVRDLEFERIETIKFGLLHFFNAKMYLHAKALELYANVYEKLKGMKLKD